MVSFKQDSIFSKGIAYGEFFDPSNYNLIGYSPYVTDFNLNGTFNAGEIEGGPGNGLIMVIPGTARLNITATAANTNLELMALPVGEAVAGGGVIETVIGVAASGASLTLTGAVAAPGAETAVCYVLTSSGSDKAAVEANSGTAYVVQDGTVQGFTPESGATYCVKYFVENSSALGLEIPSNFKGQIVRAHFAVNLYAKRSGQDVMSSSQVGVRHYYFPYYFLNGGLQDSASQTTPGTTNLSGMALSYEQALDAGDCSSVGKQLYGFIVDEFYGAQSSTRNIDGIYFIGIGGGVTVAANGTVTLPIKYSVNNQLVNISDMSAVTFASSAEGVATVSGNVVTGVAAGTADITATVTNSATGITYSDTVQVTVS